MIYQVAKGTFKILASRKKRKTWGETCHQVLKVPRIDGKGFFDLDMFVALMQLHIGLTLICRQVISNTLTFLSVLLNPFSSSFTPWLCHRSEEQEKNFAGPKKKMRTRKLFSYEDERAKKKFFFSSFWLRWNKLNSLRQRDGIETVMDVSFSSVSMVSQPSSWYNAVRSVSKFGPRRQLGYNQPTIPGESERDGKKSFIGQKSSCRFRRIFKLKFIAKKRASKLTLFSEKSIKTVLMQLSMYKVCLLFIFLSAAHVSISSHSFMVIFAWE